MSRKIWLIPLAGLYRVALAVKPTPIPEKVNARVISIGNIHAGGVGKTPLVIALARHLYQHGRAPAVVSRGYKGRLSSVGAIVTGQISAADVGDEPVEIAKALPEVPVFIGADRVKAARKAAAVAKTLILDDGFQHRRLGRDLDVVVIPGTTLPASERLLPWGHLREPLTALRKADAIVLARELGDAPPDPGRWKDFTDAPIFAAERFVSGVRAYPGTVAPTALLGRKVVVFCGIAHPERFANVVRSAGANIVGEISWSDHHAFTQRDLARIQALCAASDALAVTTEKDAARLNFQPLPFPAAIVTTSFKCDEFLEFCL